MARPKEGGAVGADLVVLPPRPPRIGKRVRCVAADTPPPCGGTPWPTSTDQWCWHCCHPFQGPPLPLPLKYDDRRDVFHVAGVYCSWGCMKTHNWESASYLKSMMANNITLLYKRCTGHLKPIKAAPPRQTLKVFGGSLSIEEFRAASEGPAQFLTLPPNVIMHHQTIHAVAEDALAPKPRAVHDLTTAVNFDNVATKNETLRLKRPKPAQNNRNLLERTMGLAAAP